LFGAELLVEFAVLILKVLVLCFQDHILFHHGIVVVDLSEILFMAAGAVFEGFGVAFCLEVVAVKLCFEGINDDFLVQGCLSEALKVAVQEVILFDQRSLL
jgi:hypothetical protein